MDRWQYDRFAEIDKHHWWFQGRRGLAKHTLERLNLPHPARLLDIGAGTGGMIPVLSQFGSLAVYEPDTETAEWTRSQYQEQFEQVRFIQEQQPMGDNYDVITAFDVLEHCENDLVTLDTWSGFLKSGGYLVITVPAFPFLFGKNDVISHHFRRYTRRSLAHLLEKANFQIKKLSYTNLAAFLPVLVSRKIKEPLETWLGKDDPPWDFNLPSKPINALLLASVDWEKHFIEFGTLPLGTSVVAVCRK